ncbi:hypothetical protein [Egbenema bharatensis]|uniref:hypothetical protein n=1 Tax=Egbenema bharatensis TaxID=3463334 RepID=UPI003A89A602
MNSNCQTHSLDWNPILQQMQTEPGQDLPIFPGDLKTALLAHAEINQTVGEAAYQLAVEISQITTQSDPEITYWFSQLVSLLHLSDSLHSTAHLSLPVYFESVSAQS